MKTDSLMALVEEFGDWRWDDGYFDLIADPERLKQRLNEVRDALDQALLEAYAEGRSDQAAEPCECQQIDEADRLVAARECAESRPLIGRALPRHKFWGAGEDDCPQELKAPNGELHTMRCKACGDGWRKSRDVCFAALQKQEPGSGWKLVPMEPTPEMIAAYLRANDAYWKRTDELPAPPNKWRTGTPSEATAESYRAMLAATPSTQQGETK